MPDPNIANLPALSELHVHRGQFASPLYMQQDDYLALSAYNSVDSVVLSLHYRFIDADTGRPTVGEMHLTPTTDRVVTRTFASLGQGWLTHARVVLSAGTPKRGQCFVRLSVQKGDTTAGFGWGQLIANYITAALSPSWPHDKLYSSLEGPGCIRSITGTDPAAGAEISETVPAGARWQLICLHATLVNSATVANRLPSLVVDDGTTIYYRSIDTGSLTASNTYPISWSAYGGVAQAAVRMAGAPIPANLLLTAGHRMRTITNGIDSGDNWGAPQYVVEEWIEA